MAKLVSHENNKAVFTEVVSYADFKESLKEAYKQNKHRFNIHGFRKGKAPRAIIEANYGKDVFWNDALDLLLPDMYEKSIDELKLEPVSRPKVDVEEMIEEGKDIEVKFEVETYPDIKLADYSNIEVEELSKDVDESLVDARIQEEIEKNKILKPVEREIQIGDLVNIDFEGFKNDVAFEGGKAENYELKIGSNTFIPGFEEGLIGKNKGEELDLNITFPEDYQAEDLKGQEVVFKVKINDIVEEIFPELDDDFVMDVSEFDTVDEYKNSIREELQKKLDENNEIKVENTVLDEVVKRTEFEVPQAMVEEQLHDELHEYEHQLSHMGLDMKTYLSITNSTEEDLKEQLRERAINKVKMQVILDKLVENNNYEVSEEEIDKEYNDAMKQYGKEGDEEFKKLLKAQADEEQVKKVIQRRKAIDALVENVVFVENKEDEKAEDKESSDKE